MSKALAFSVLATLEDESFFISPKFHFQPVASALGQILNTKKFPAQPSPFSFPDTPRSSLAYLPARLTIGLNLLGILVPRTQTYERACLRILALPAKTEALTRTPALGL